MTRPKEIIEQTFNVFSGPQQTMDQSGFARFCESSKRVVASDANAIFCTVVQNSHSGMDLHEFKAALGLLVNVNRKTGSCDSPHEEKRCLGECVEAREVVKPARQVSSGRRKSCLENHSKNKAVGLKPKHSSTFRWSPLDVAEPISGVQDTLSPSRTIRWCPAELEE
jgi:hypothetical protein